MLALLAQIALLTLPPPPNLVSTNGTLRGVLALHHSAAGALRTGVSDTRIDSWRVTFGGLDGTESSFHRGEDYREDDTIGPFHTAQGALGGLHWEQNANGLVRTITDLHRRDEIDRSALAHAPNSSVTLIGEIRDPAAYVVRVAPPNGRVEYLYYDKKTGNIVRRDRDEEGRREVTTYDDFRTTDGRTEAWHVHTSNELPFDDADSTMQSLSFGEPIDQSKLAIPAGTASVALSTRSQLPARFVADRVIVTLEIQGHKVNLQLDSGASEIFMDNSILQALKIPVYGKNTEFTAGEYMVARAIVPQIRIGNAVMQNVAVVTAPFAMPTDRGPVAGLLGYDFFDGCVVHVDYLNEKLEAIPFGEFTPPAGAVALTIALDDRIPTIPVKIASSQAPHFGFDTGADRSMLFVQFAQAHPDDAVDQGLGSQIVASFPFGTDVSGVGGQISIHPVQVSTLMLGNVSFPRWLLFATEDPHAFDIEDYDGLIGQDILRNFDVYFDYRDLKIYLVPNDRYKQRWGG